MLDTKYIALIPLLPLITFFVIALFGKNYFPKYCGLLGTVSLVASLILSATVAYQYFFVAGQVNGVYQPIIAFKYAWLQFSQNISIDMGIILDPISVMMIIVVAFVSTMVHIYRLVHMHD